MEPVLKIRRHRKSNSAPDSVMRTGRETTATTDCAWTAPERFTGHRIPSFGCRIKFFPVINTRWLSASRAGGYGMPPVRFRRGATVSWRLSIRMRIPVDTPSKMNVSFHLPNRLPRMDFRSFPTRFRESKGRGHPCVLPCGLISTGHSGLMICGFTGRESKPMPS